jgi:hypothetical protein
MNVLEKKHGEKDILIYWSGLIELVKVVMMMNRIWGFRNKMLKIKKYKKNCLKK